MIRSPKQIILLLAIAGLYILFLLRLNYAFQYESPAYDPTEPYKLGASKQIMQKIEPQTDKIYGIAVRFCTYWVKNEGRVSVRLYENGALIGESSCMASELGQDKYHDFLFHKAVRINPECDHYISVECDHDNDWNVLSAYLSSGGDGLSEGDRIIENSTLCYRLIMVNDGMKRQAAVLFGIIALIMFAAVLFKYMIIPDISYGRLLVGIVGAALIVEMFATDLLHDIRHDVDIAKYDPLEKIQEIGPGETRHTGFDNRFGEADRFLFFAEGSTDRDISVKLENTDTGEVYFDRKIRDDEMQFDNNTEKNAIVLSASDSESLSDRFDVGFYDISITNTGSDGNIGISMVEDAAGDQSLNAELIRVSWAGHRIAMTVMLILIIYLTVVFLLVRREDFSVYRFYLASVIPLSAVFFLLMLPWSPPDTGSHFNAIYRLSNMVMGCNKDNAWQIRSDDLDFYENIWTRTGYNPDMQDYLLASSGFSLKAADRNMVEWPDPEVKMEYYSIIGYLPQVVGFVLGRLLGLGTVFVIYLGRAAILTVYIIAGYHAVKTAPVGKIIFALTAVTPMTLMMSSALSYDSMVIISTLCFISSVLALYRDKDKPMRYLTESAIWAFVIGGVKGGGYLILLPLVFVLWDKDRKRSLKLTVPILVSGIMSVIFFDVIMPAGSHLFQFGGAPGVLSSSFAWKHPVKFIDMCIKTYLKYIDNYMINMGGIKLAWLDAVIPNSIIVGLMLLTGLYAIFESDELSLQRKDKWIMALILFIMFATTPMMLLSFNGIGAERIDGIQGRYYLPALPLIYMLLTKYKLKSVTVHIDQEKTYELRHTCFRLYALLMCICVYYMMRLYLTR